MIGDAITAALPILRTNAESLQIDRCRIERETSDFDEETQQTVVVWELVRDDVPCHFDQPSVSSQSLLTDELTTVDSPLLATHYSVTDALPDDRVTIVSSADPLLAGATLWVTQVSGDTHPVERLIQCRWVR